MGISDPLLSLIVLVLNRKKTGKVYKGWLEGTILQRKFTEHVSAGRNLNLLQERATKWKSRAWLVNPRVATTPVVSFLKKGLH